MPAHERPVWQLPPGVSRGTWDYVHDKSIAADYDQFHADHPLLKLDRELIASRIPQDSLRSDGTIRLAIDVGCGPGRNLIPLAKLGWHVVGVDLSHEMLRSFSDHANVCGLTASCVQLRANMAQLDCLQQDIADAVLCMYSSVGMVQGRANRVAFMKHACRLVRSDGLFFVHVHNRGTWWRDPGGFRRAIGDWVRSKRDATWEFGDRVYPYRGLPTMFLHIYSKKELESDLATAGFRSVEVISLDRESKSIVNGPWFSYLRCGGFIAICRKDYSSGLTSTIASN